VRSGTAGIVLLLGGILLGQRAALTAAEAPPTLTLAQAVGLALDNNQQIVDATGALEEAFLSKRLAQSDFKPKFGSNILGSFGQTDVSNQTYGFSASQRFASGTAIQANVGAVSLRNQLGNFYSTDTTLEVSQSLLRGFGRAAATRNLLAAEASLADASRQLTLTSEGVGVEVAAAYYSIISQQQLVGVAERAAQRSRSLLEAAEAKLQAGKVSQLDVFRSQQLSAQSEGTLFDARAAVDDAKDQIRLLIGRGPEFDFSVEGDIPLVASPPDISNATALALGNRLELITAQSAVREAERAVSLAKNDALPQVDVNLALTRRDVSNTLGTGFGLNDFHLATFLGVVLPLDRTPGSVARERSTVELDRRKRDLQTLTFKIETEVRRAFRQDARLTKDLELADTSVRFAEQEAELANLRYERGLSNNLDVVNAESNLLVTRARRLGILGQLAVARLQLRATEGILDPRTDVR
jgi:outer membrane protein